MYVSNALDHARRRASQTVLRGTPRADQFLETMTGHGTVIQRARCLARRALRPAASETAPMHSAISRRTPPTESAAAMQAGGEVRAQGEEHV